MGIDYCNSSIQPQCIHDIVHRARGDVQHCGHYRNFILALINMYVI